MLFIHYFLWGSSLRGAALCQIHTKSHCSKCVTFLSRHIPACRDKRILQEKEEQAPSQPETNATSICVCFHYPWHRNGGMQTSEDDSECDVWISCTTIMNQKRWQESQTAVYEQPVIMLKTVCLKMRGLSYFSFPGTVSMCFFSLITDEFLFQSFCFRLIFTEEKENKGAMVGMNLWFYHRWREENCKNVFEINQWSLIWTRGKDNY